MKKIVFRVDSGNHIGMGHLMRCLTLAGKLKESGCDISFITKNHLGFNKELIEESFSCFTLMGGVTQELNFQERNDYHHWLGSDLIDDLDQTNQVLGSLGKVDLVIVDHYSLDASFESKVHASKVMVIDDLQNRSHQCDLILDQNLGADQIGYESSSLKESSIFLMGPNYSLLRQEFADMHNQVDINNFTRPVKDILIFMGGKDIDSNTFRIASLIDEDMWKRYSFTFVLDSAHKDYQELNSLVARHSKSKLFGLSKQFSQLMIKTDLFIGAGGATSWERATLGVASAIFSVADNQVNNCKQLHAAGVAYNLGDLKKMTSQKWREFFQLVVGNDALWQEMRNNGFILVDGLGVCRVAEVIRDKLLSE